MDWYDPQALFQATQEWLQTNQHWAGVIAFVIAAAESLAGIGILVPGITLFFAIGALIGTGELNFWIIAWWAFAGAVLGDNLSYWLGKRYRAQLWSVWPLSRYPNLPLQGEQFFAKHGGKSIIFGRFVGPIRAVVPAVAGMSNMPSGYFFAVNVLSALLWAPLILLPGVLFGDAIEQAKSYLFEILLIALVFFGLLNGWMWLAKRWYNGQRPAQSMLKITAALLALMIVCTTAGWAWWQLRANDLPEQASGLESM